MFDRRLARLAVRNRAAGLVVATTGSMALAATTTGYTRASGSFVTDGFLVGMEVTPTGFTQTTPGIIDAVSALSMTITGGRTAETSAIGRSLTVGLPAIRPYTNVGTSRVQNRPYFTDALVPGAAVVKTFPTSTGIMREEPISVLTWFGLSGKATDAIDVSVNKLLALFSPATELSLGDGTKMQVRGDVAPKSGDVLELDGGWAYCQATIAWRIDTVNAVVTP